MKTNLLSICVLLCANILYGQSGISQGQAKNQNHQIPTAKLQQQLPQLTAFWSDDLSTSANWVLTNQTGNTDNWVIGTGVPAGSFPIPGILSTTATNGYALFDSDLLCSGDQVADLTTANAINCSTEPSVILSFEQAYRRYDDSPFVFVSVDNVNWTKFPVNEAFANNQSSTNPQVVSVDISSVAANQATVWIRFQFWSPSTYITGPGTAPGCAYAWMIDDVSLAAGSGGTTFDDCASAVDITSGFGGAIGTVNTLGPYDNTGATVSPTDPSTGWECFGEPNGSGSAPELNNTVWFTFTGDGNNYFVESNTSCPGVTNAIDDGDTQFALYTGTSCTSLTPIKCNEDGPGAGAGGAPPYPAGFSFGTTAGQTYYLLVDGFSFNGAVSDGEFCIAISRQTSVACTSSTVTAGTYTVSDTILCPGDTATINVTGAVAPNQGSFYGISMMISNAPLTGSTDPLNDPSFIAAYSVVEPVPATFSRRYINDGSLINGTTLPWGTYYWTPVVFGNAIPTSPAVTFLTDLTLDPSCTITGTSVAIQVLSGTDPLCNTQSMAENNGPDHGIINLYPVPVRDQLNLVYHSLSNERVRLEVKDQLGRLVKEYSSQVINGKNILAMETSELSRGVYFITVIGENSNFNARFTKE